MGILEKRADSLDYIFVDTPGQIEAFTWSAAGSFVRLFVCSFVRLFVCLFALRILHNDNDDDTDADTDAPCYYVSLFLF